MDPDAVNLLSYCALGFLLAFVLLTVVVILRRRSRRLKEQSLRDIEQGLQHPGVRTRKGLKARCPGKVVQLAKSPQLFLLPGFCSSEECDHLIAQGQSNLVRCRLSVGSAGPAVSDKRTSFGAGLRRGLTETVSRIEQRISRLTQVPLSHGGQMQVLRYEPGQLCYPHVDHTGDASQLTLGIEGQQLLTVLIYLTTVEEGGETVFCRAPSQSKPLPPLPQFPEVSWSGLAVKPRKGDAVIFYNLQPNGQLDPASQHAAYPVLKGEKWAALKWMLTQPAALAAAAPATAAAAPAAPALTAPAGGSSAALEVSRPARWDPYKPITSPIVPFALLMVGACSRLKRATEV